MGFRNDAYATVWKVTQEAGKNYTTVSLSISKKNQQTDKYETDFRNNFVRFIGTAHKNAGQLQERTRIQLKEVDVSNYYDKEKGKEYVTFKVFAFDLADDSANTKAGTSTAATDLDDDDPFGD